MGGDAANGGGRGTCDGGGAEDFGVGGVLAAGKGDVGGIGHERLGVGPPVGRGGTVVGEDLIIDVKGGAGFEDEGVGEVSDCADGAGDDDPSVDGDRAGAQ